MTLQSFLESLRRRWYLVVGGLLITAVLCGITFAVTPPGYQRTASVLLIPGTSSIPVGGNPYLYLGGLGPASDVLVRGLEADAATDTVLGDLPDAEIAINRDSTTSGPLVTITVVARSDRDAAAIHERLLQLLPVTLSTLQTRANVPQDSRISSLPLTVDSESVIIQKNRLEAAGAVAAAGVAFTVLLVGLVDGLLLSPPPGSPLPALGRLGRRRQRNRENHDRQSAAAVTQRGPTTATEPTPSARREE